MDYIMAMKSGWFAHPELRNDKLGNELNSVIWRTQAPTLSEAKNYFVRLKDLPEKEFDKLFIVTKVSER